MEPVLVEYTEVFGILVDDKEAGLKGEESCGDRWKEADEKTRREFQEMSAREQWQLEISQTKSQRHSNFRDQQAALRATNGDQNRDGDTAIEPRTIPRKQSIELHRKISSGNTLKKNDDAFTAEERTCASALLEERMKKAMDGLPNSNTQPIDGSVEAFQKRYTLALAEVVNEKCNRDTRNKERVLSNNDDEVELPGGESSCNREEAITCQKDSLVDCRCIHCLNLQDDNVQATLKDAGTETNGTTTARDGARPTTVKNWASLLAGPSMGRGKIPLTYTPVSGDETNPVVDISDNEFGEENKKYEDYLVGSFIGRKLAYLFVKDTLSKFWALKGDFEMSTKGFNMYFLKFSNSEDREKALEAGSQHIASRLNHEGLGRIASSIGVRLYLDRTTEDGGRDAFSRVCVEVNTKCKFPEVITLKCSNGLMPQVFAEYAWYTIKCSHCGVFGHNEYNCEHCPKPQSIRPPLGLKHPLPTTTSAVPKQSKAVTNDQLKVSQNVKPRPHTKGKQQQQQKWAPTVTKESVSTSNKFQALSQGDQEPVVQDLAVKHDELKGNKVDVAINEELERTNTDIEEVIDLEREEGNSSTQGISPEGNVSISTSRENEESRGEALVTQQKQERKAQKKQRREQQKIVKALKEDVEKTSPSVTKYLKKDQKPSEPPTESNV
ncbi:hypothetical protein GIB67_018612 [Kingdonia uniflora]|uniref:Uncharacterized protein n=1 Tax=Kingdonia uniflora TaxID=39325 RepID=A0A7J7L8C3_9MAGN|nr:hypothetical protein GIB67_018612 [Kingdonia uniflora]